MQNFDIMQLIMSGPRTMIEPQAHLSTYLHYTIFLFRFLSDMKRGMANIPSLCRHNNTIIFFLLFHDDIRCDATF